MWPRLTKRTRCRAVIQSKISIVSDLAPFGAAPEGGRRNRFVEWGVGIRASGSGCGACAGVSGPSHRSIRGVRPEARRFGSVSSHRFALRGRRLALSQHAAALALPWPSLVASRHSGRHVRGPGERIRPAG